MRSTSECAKNLSVGDWCGLNSSLVDLKRVAAFVRRTSAQVCIVNGNTYEFTKNPLVQAVI